MVLHYRGEGDRMTFFEMELRKVMENNCYDDKLTFLPPMCYVKVGDYIRMRLEFEGDGHRIYGKKGENRNGTFTSRNQKIIRK